MKFVVHAPLAWTLNNNNIYLGKSNQAARKGAGPSKLATQKSNKENAIHAQKNMQNKNTIKGPKRKLEVPYEKYNGKVG